MQYEVDRREALVEAGEGRREQRRRQRGRRANGEASTSQVAELADLERGAIDVGDHAARPGKQDLACGGERDVTLHSVEERGAKLFLEHADATRHRWLSDPQPARGLGEVPRLSDRDEVPKLMELHVRR